MFKRRDKRCLTLPPRSSLIPVFIHFSDFFPDLVQATLSKCKALILGAERVVILKPNQGKPMIDDVVWEGPGSSLPDRCWDRQGVILRTLDIVAYKVGARDRKRELLPIEQQLWDVMGPFLCRIRDFAKSLNEGAIELEQKIESMDAVHEVLQSQTPWSLRVSAVLTDAAPAVGDREHILYYSPKHGVFTREFLDHPDDQDKDSGIPLVTLPCRLQSVMPTYPSVPQVLRYLVSIAERVANEELRKQFKTLAGKCPVPEEKKAQPHQPAEPSEPHPDDQPSSSAGGTSSSENCGPNVFDIGIVEVVSRGNKRGAGDRNCASVKNSKRLKIGAIDTADE